MKRIWQVVGVGIGVLLAGVVAWGIFRSVVPASGPVGINYQNVNTLYTTSQVVTSTRTGAGGLPLLAMTRHETRVYGLIQNDCTSDIYIYLTNFSSDVTASTTAVANNGIRLVAGGGSYEILPENLYVDDVWVATTTAACKILVTEKF